MGDNLNIVKIEVLHSRNPDYECDVHVFIDGVEATINYYEDIDPGRGYELSYWRERIAEARESNLSPAFRTLVVDELEANESNQYIVNDLEE